ncbi:MAG: leucyl/phenylalanyl-tRNA--protein transferase [Bacteroidales bacterium]|jgi:leucyl/phenylalanyl-tRNA--protein transferase
MPVFKLPKACVFPEPDFSEPDGLLAYGGDLSVKRLLAAYSKGIFPWFSDEDPILWWSPDPRMVLYPKEFKRHKSLRTLINSNKFMVTFDTSFEAVIRKCAEVARAGQPDGTWITEEMIKAYLKLHQKGYAHSVETWFENQLVGGLYGVSIGGMFFGESMFHLMSNASKVALWYLVDLLLSWDFDLIDAQQETNHLRNMGGKLIARKVFLHLLVQSTAKSSRIGSWSNKIDGKPRVNI